MGVTVKFYRGAWWIFINHHGRRRSKKVGDRVTAEQMAREIRERLARADLQLLPSQRGGETLRAYSAAWLESNASCLKASSLRFYRDNLENHIWSALGSTPVGSISRADVKALLLALRSKNLSHRTITGIVRTLSTVLSEAVEDGKLPANPALRPGRLRRQLRDPNAPKKAVIDPYTREEVELLVETARLHFPEWHAFMLCAVRTGLRLGELRALEWGDIDWRQRFLYVQRNFVEGAATTPKSGRARKVDMSLQLRAILRLWRRRQRAAWFLRGRGLPDLVFASTAGTTLDDSNIRKAVLSIVKKAEVRRRRSAIHVLRHTFGSLLIQQGESLAYVRDQMGHASIQVTVDIYGHLVPGGNRAAVDRLDSDTSRRIPDASGEPQQLAVGNDKFFGINGEPGGNRTPNPQIKSLLLCQLSYRPAALAHGASVRAPCPATSTHSSCRQRPGASAAGAAWRV
jgi:integrase